MTCYNPRTTCYSRKEFKKYGKKNIKFDVLQGETPEAQKVNYKHYPPLDYEYIKVPCGKCVGCRSANAKSWSVRAYQEAQMHKDNCFITLTYADDSDIVLDDPLCLFSLRYRHFQLFMKKLRKEYKNDKIRFIVSGEYGTQSGRAHWHAILFGFDFPDKKLETTSKGYRHFSSSTLSKLWPHGLVDIANVDYGTCQYVAQYVLKKLPDMDDPIYLDFKGQKLEFTDRCPEIVRMSNRRGIGYQWFEKYGEQSVLNQQILIKNNSGKPIKCRPPRYYEALYDVINHSKMEEIKEERTEKMKNYYEKYSITKDKLKTWMDAHLHRIKKSRSKNI